MVNLNYRRGADKERTIVRKARNNGLVAFRSAGSHSPIDVCIIDTSHKSIKLIQCKHSVRLKGGIEPGLKRKLEEEFKPIFDGSYSVEFLAI